MEWKECADEDTPNRETEWTMIPHTVSYVNGSDKVSGKLSFYWQASVHTHTHAHTFYVIGVIAELNASLISF